MAFEALLNNLIFYPNIDNKNIAVNLFDHLVV